MKNSWQIAVFALGLGVWASAPGRAQLRAPASGVSHVTLAVRELPRSLAFFRRVLGFRLLARSDAQSLWRPLPAPTERLPARVLALGEQRVALVARATGAPYPDDARSDDLSFQHLALVTRDMDAAARRLAAHDVSAISRGGPQTIPASNPAAGGVRAYYFRDPDRHPLELIWFPQGKGDPRWQAPQRGELLGIDHTAIAVRDRARSIAWSSPMRVPHMRSAYATPMATRSGWCSFERPHCSRNAPHGMVPRRST